MKPKLYQYAACPFCSKVKSMLAYKKVEYETVEVNPMNKKEIAFSTDYRAVPIYIDSQGQQINDSNVILQHIDSEFPQPKVFSEDPLKKAEDEKWLTWSEKFVKGLPTVIYDNLSDALLAFDYIIKTGKFGWFQSRMIKYSGAFVMSLVAKKIRTREGIINPDDFVKRMMSEWTTGLAGRKFMGDEKPSASDIAVFGISRSVAALPRPNSLFHGNVVFWEWFTRMTQITGLSSSVL